MIRAIEVKPIGTRKTAAFVDSFNVDGRPIPEECGLREIDLPVYPESRGRELRQYRTRYRLGLRETSEALGWTAMELCEVERGKRAPEDWGLVFAALNRLAAGRLLCS